MQVRRAVTAVVLVLAVVTAGCTSEGSSGSEEPGTDQVGDGSIDAHGGTGQIWLVDEPDIDVVLYGPDGQVVTTDQIDENGVIAPKEERTTDENGALMMRYVEPGEGYVVKRADDPSVTSEPITVTAIDEHPEPGFYQEQEITEGYGYLTTRDGTKLSINVTLPGPAEEGPYPTVIEYSGYDPSNPDPSLVVISKTIAATQGFATVGINMRGSGCSGGAFQLFEDAHATDGYDVVETIAAQDWVANDQVGLVGISYPATAMLYAASTQPPSLAAIAPMAAYDDGFRALLWPGGIQNNGFAREWIQGRYDDSNPENVEWVSQIIDGGDETCADNMAMRGQLLDLPNLIDELPYFPEINNLGNRFAPETFVDQIEVPTFLVASWQDEQVGGHAPSMLDEFTNAEQRYVTLVNGLHAEGLANPTVLQRWLEFLQLYVAEEVPDTTALDGFSKVVAGQIIRDADAATALPALEEHYPEGTTYEEALADFEAQPRVRLLLDSGAAEGYDPGLPLAGFEAELSAYPPPEVEPTTFYLGPDGTLTSDAPTATDDAPDSVDSYVSDPSVRPPDHSVEGEDPWERLPEYDWAQPVPENSLSYLTGPLDEDTVMVGSASADLWLRSTEPDADLQVTLSEVRPDGKESYVQTGWLRASKRALDEDRSTELQPLITQLQGEAEPLPEDEFVPVRLEIYPFAHAFRAGSQIRVVVSAPGGDRWAWRFDTLDATPTIEIGRSPGRPSAVVFPVHPDITVPTDLPPCPSLRGQACRDYVPGG